MLPVLSNTFCPEQRQGTCHGNGPLLVNCPPGTRDDRSDAAAVAAVLTGKLASER